MARGLFAEAEAELRQVYREFQSLQSTYTTELVALDLAHVFLLAGRNRLAGELAAMLHKIFAARGIHREALIALHIYRQAVA